MLGRYLNCMGKRVFIAGALSSKEVTNRTPSRVVVDYLANVHKMVMVASEVRKLGHYPFIPALDLLCGIVGGNWNEEDYRGMSTGFLEVCDCVLVISMSIGVEREIKVARQLGIPIYHGIEEI